MRYFAKVRYVGTNFHGFQVQPDQRTVQGILCEACLQGLKCEASVTGCSRTDAGVHADAMCVVIDAPMATVPAEKLPLALLPFLPSDVSVFEADVCPDGFHPRYDVVGKEYVYRLLNTRVPDPFLANRIWHFPRSISEEGLVRMQAAAKNLLGKHDFTSFMAENSDTDDTVRTISSFTVERRGDEIVFTVLADGFLYNMVRIMVGTLVETAFGRFSPEDIPSILKGKNRALAGMTAPADGLYLHRVLY